MTAGPPVDPLALFLRHSPICVCVRAALPPFAFTYLSPNLPRLLGVAPEEFIGDAQRWAARVHAEDRPRVPAEIAALAGRRSSATITYRVMHADGTERWLEEVLNVDAGDGGASLTGYLTDVTEHRLLLDELVASEERYTRIVQGSIAGMWDLNIPEQRITTSPRLLELLGFSDDLTTAVDMDWWMERLHPEDAPAFRAALQAHLSAIAPLDLECRIRRADGEYRWFHLYGQAAWLGDLEATHVAGWCEDVSARRRLEDQFRQATKMEAMGRLAAGVAHDFNNLLTAINGYAQLMRDALDQHPAARADAQEIILASNRASTLTRQLLAFSRQQAVEPRAVQLDEAVAAIQKMLKRLVGERIELVARPSSPDAVIRIDPGHLEQVLLNLVVNARDAMPDGGRIVISTDIVGELPEHATIGATGVPAGPYVELAVQDTGVGMDAVTLERIFEPFFTTKEQGRGTGLGLATVYGIVSQSLGRIAVDSTPGTGTTFRLFFAQTAPTVETALADAGRPRGAAGRQATILLVEDEEMVRMVMHRILTLAGHRVVGAASGRDALMQARQMGIGIDLLVTDLVMPGMSGTQVYESLIAEFPALKVLFVSGYSGEHHPHVVGANLLQKPFSPSALIERVDRILSGEGV